ncbi:hypothetical protein FXO38_00888 [Capsicum annuum]|nr:hypothetical protein FXO38_00888 [Capsicum annuum]
MKRKQNKSEEPNLDLCLITPVAVDPINKISTLEEAAKSELSQGHGDPNVDVKKLRRTIAKKLAGQRSRAKKVDIANLEKKVKALQNRIVVETIEEVYMKDYKEHLQMENEMLRKRVDSVTDYINRQSAQTKELKLELKRLKLAKAQEEEHMKGESFNFYDYDEAKLTQEIDINNDINTDQYRGIPSSSPKQTSLTDTHRDSSTKKSHAHTTAHQKTDDTQSKGRQRKVELTGAPASRPCSDRHSVRGLILAKSRRNYIVLRAAKYRAATKSADSGEIGSKFGDISHGFFLVFSDNGLVFDLFVCFSHEFGFGI